VERDDKGTYDIELLSKLIPKQVDLMVSSHIQIEQINSAMIAQSSMMM
jgi:hypothetical protein